MLWGWATHPTAVRKKGMDASARAGGTSESTERTTMMIAMPAAAASCQWGLGVYGRHEGRDSHKWKKVGNGVRGVEKNSRTVVTRAADRLMSMRVIVAAACSLLHEMCPNTDFPR